MALPKPDWKDWIKRPRVQYWEAIALARDVDPYAVTYWLEAKNSFWFGEESRSRDPWDSSKSGLPKKQRRWLDSLIAAAEHAESRPFQIFYPLINERSDILLREFASFAVHRMEWTVPEPLAALANTPTKLANRGKWPWGNYENENLRMLEQAVMKFWATWKEGEEEHINKTVQAFLQDRGMQKEPAEQVATLIRPDPLKKGGRPPVKKSG